MPGSRTLLVVATALAVFAAAVAGCGTDEPVVRIGVLADCQGALRGFGDGELAGAELAFLRRGARLLGTGPSGGVSAIDVGGRRVELVQGCQETGEHTLYIEEARRLLENEHVDVVVGGASVVARELARRYPRAVFVSTFWDEQEITMRRPAANLFRFSPDYAQREAGLGAYAYHQLGWRRAAVVADYANPGWAGAAAFTAEFCALGGHVVTTVYAGTQDRVGRALAMQPDGIATFVEYIDPAKILGSLASKLHDPRRLLVSSANLEDPRAHADRRTQARRGRREHLASVVASVARAPRLPAALARCVPRTSRRLREPFGSHRVLQRPRGNGLGVGAHSLR